MTRIINTIALLIFIVTAIHIGIKRGARGRYTLAERFLRDDNAANAARKAPVGEEHFLRVDAAALPVRGYDENDEARRALLSAQLRALDCAAAQMIKFRPPKSNYEVKMEFGPANLDFVAGCEERFNRYMLALNHWAELLRENGNAEDAKRVLHHAVDAGSDIAKSYTALAELYAEENDPAGLRLLLEQVSQADYLPLKDKIERKVADKLAELETGVSAT